MSPTHARQTTLLNILLKTVPKRLLGEDPPRSCVGVNDALLGSFNYEVLD